jgi:hypothetical protein
VAAGRSVLSVMAVLTMKMYPRGSFPSPKQALRG